MGGYLQHLVLRTLQPASPVQPLIASRFEPGIEAAVAEPVADSPATQSAHISEPAQAEPTAAPGHVERRLDAVVALAPQVHPAIAQPMRAAPPPTLPESRSDTREPERTMAPPNSLPPPREQRVAPTPISPLPLPAPPAPAETRVESSPPEVVHHEIVVTRLVAGEPAQSAKPLAPPMPQAVLAQPRKPALPTRALPSRPKDLPHESKSPEPATAKSSVLAPLLRAVPAPFAVRPEPQGAARAPDVHITIGSVEIRAQSAPARTQSAPKAKAQRPSLTLADYLQRRRGERS